MRSHQNIFVRSVALATLALALSPALITGQATASTTSECQALIAALRADTPA